MFMICCQFPADPPINPDPGFRATYLGMPRTMTFDGTPAPTAFSAPRHGPEVTDTFDVLIIGGGNAGVSTAARLLREHVTDNVAIIEPQQVHTYRPMLSYVGSGQARLADAQKTQRSVTPDGCRWIEDSVVSIDAESRTVRTSSGREYKYTDLIIAAGLVPDLDELPNVFDALETPAVASNYLDRAEKTASLVDSIALPGHAVFTLPRPPVSCSGTTLKPLFLAASQWQRDGRLPRIDITLVVDRSYLVGVPALDDILRRRLDELGVRVLFDTSISGIEADHQRLHIHGGGTRNRIDYDFLHLVPRFRGPSWLADLADDTPAHLVDIDPMTFRHVRHDSIWSLGDIAATGTDPSGGALRKQAATLVDNVAAARNSQPLATYDGYTVAPVAVDSHTLIAGEFDRDFVVSSSLPSFLDPLKPRRSAFLFDRYALPQAYWRRILRGRL